MPGQETLSGKNVLVPRFFRTFLFFRASVYIGEVVGDSPLRLVEPSHFGQPPGVFGCRSMGSRLGAKAKTQLFESAPIFPERGIGSSSYDFGKPF